MARFNNLGEKSLNLNEHAFVKQTLADYCHRVDRGTADDVAGPISFLCGPESAYMTGTVLNVTGGIVLAG